MMLIILFVTLIIIRIVNPREVKTERIIYDYSLDANLDYKVYLKENEIFDANYLEMGGMYLTQLTDFLEITYDFRFLSQDTANLSYSYEIYPYIESVSGAGDNRDILWIKDYPDIASSKKTTDETRVNQSYSYIVRLDDYLAFVKEIQDLYQVSSEDTLVLNLQGKIYITVEDNVISKNFEQKIYIPLTQKLYKITSGEDVSIEDNLIEFDISFNRINLVAIVGLVLSFTILLLSIKFITLKEPKLEREIVLDKIYKEHASRLVKLINLTNDQIQPILIEKFKDLLIIADEIVQPIFYYEMDTNNVKVVDFMIFDSKRCYKFTL